MAKTKNKRNNHNKINDIKQKIDKLEKQKIELQNKLSDSNKELKKHCRIKRLKLSKDILNFTLPFVICTGISIGTTSWLGFGLPYKEDNIYKYKRYDLSYCTDEGIELEGTYERRTILDDDLPSSKLSIYYPWEEDNGIYTRSKRVYDLDRDNLKDLQEAILNNDIDFINEYKESYKEEKQTCNKKLYNDEDNKIYIDCELHYLDKSDTIQVKESFYRNFLVTLISLLTGIGLGFVVAYNRKFSLLRRLKDESRYHSLDIENCRVNIRIINNNLNDINTKIEELNKKLVKSNAKK